MEVKIVAKVDVQFKLFIEMMTDFDFYWDASLCHISKVKHRTRSTSGESPPVHCTQYKTGPRKVEFDMSEIDEILSMGVSEQTERNGRHV